MSSESTVILHSVRHAFVALAYRHALVLSGQMDSDEKRNSFLHTEEFPQEGEVGSTGAPRQVDYFPG